MSVRTKLKAVTLMGSTGKDKIYATYLEAFKKGVYNFIREEEDTATGEMIPRKYFSGGVSAYEINGIYQEINNLDGAI